MEKKYLVWVVDDDAWIRKLITLIAKEQGIKTQSFPDANSVLQKLETGWKVDKLDFVITDLQLPGINGFEIVERLIAEGLPVNRIAMMSGYWDKDAIHHAKQLCIKVFKKPFSVDEMVCWIGQIKHEKTKC